MPHRRATQQIARRFAQALVACGFDDVAAVQLEQYRGYELPALEVAGHDDALAKLCCLLRYLTGQELLALQPDDLKFRLGDGEPVHLLVFRGVQIRPVGPLH